MSNVHDERLMREMAFHNERFTEEVRVAQGKYYFAIDDGAERFRRRVDELAHGADVLEYGCAKGARAVRLAHIAKSVSGIDISDVAISQAETHAREASLSNATFAVMNAEAMNFPDASFDLVFGSGIIHHLDVPRSMKEIRRVLRPGGSALFWEPLGHNPIINLYRQLTPKARTDDEHPLLRSDFSTIEENFSVVRLKRYGLLSLMSVPFRKSGLGRPMRSVLAIADRAIFAVPLAKWWCWYVSMELRA